MKYPLLCCFMAARALPLQGQTAGILSESQEQDGARMPWWREAGFGLFIHWGLYAIPAGEWEGKTTYGEWSRNRAHIPLEE